MLQRRIGMICTSSGCAVSVRPRTNSRSDRALRLALSQNGHGSKIIALGGRLGRAQPPQPCSPILIDPVNIGRPG